MKFKRFLSIFLVVFFSLSVFILPSEAVVVSVPEYLVEVSESVTVGGSYSFPKRSVVVDPFDSTLQHSIPSYTYDYYNRYDDIDITTSFSLYTKDGSPFLNKGGISTVSFSDVWLGSRFDFGSTQIWSGKSYLITVDIYYGDGTIYTIKSAGSPEDIFTDYNTTTRLHDFTFEFLPTSNVYRIDYFCKVTLGFDHSGSITCNYRLGEFDDPLARFSLQIDQSDYIPPVEPEPDVDSDEEDNSGLLSGIKSFFKTQFSGLWSYFDDFFDQLNSLKSILLNAIPYEIRTGFESFKNYIIDIYNKLTTLVDVITNHLTDSLVGALTSVRDYIVNVYNKLYDLYNVISLGIESKLSSLLTGIVNLPDTILQGVKNIFIPDVKTLEAELDATVENISSQFGVHFDSYDRLFDREVAPEDVYEDYYIPGVGTLKLKFFDSSFLIKGVAYFRPFIRGFLVLLLLFYNWKQVLTLFDQNPAIAGGAVQGLASHKESPQMKIDL